jgi:NAD-dependent deacetylase
MKTKKHIVFLTGAGISAESGIKTFRDQNGLWEKYDINEVATPEAWNKNPKLVLDFYNERRLQVLKAQPNQAHIAIKELEIYFKVSIITQNIDDLHERAGSTNILHLHGEILYGRSTGTGKSYKLKNPVLKIGDCCPDGYQLRPDIVWFNEPVPKIMDAYEITSTADVLVIVGTSLNVYPAAGLYEALPKHASVFLIDPNSNLSSKIRNVTFIKEKATIGIPIVANKLKEKFSIT